MSATISQLCCFIPIHRKLRRRSFPCIALQSKSTVVMSLEGHDAETSSSRNLPNLSYSIDSRSSIQGAITSSVTDEHIDGKIGTQGPLNPSTIEQKRAAKIHDFCFGIPFGGFVLTEGLLGFVFSRNVATLGNGALFGGAVLALSTIT